MGKKIVIEVKDSVDFAIIHEDIIDFLQDDINVGDVKVTIQE